MRWHGLVIVSVKQKHSMMFRDGHLFYLQFLFFSAIKEAMNKLIPIAIIIAAFVIGGSLLYMNQAQEEIPEGLLSPQEAAEKAITYINENFLQEGIAPASLVSTLEENDLYKVTFDFQGQEVEIYVTRNGKFLLPEIINLDESIQNSSENNDTQPIDISSEELTKFVECLDQNELLIYGANWCGWTQKLVEMLGGFDMVKPIYIECVEQEQLCQEKGISGFPTIFIKGEKYEGPRTFKDLSAATSCPMPLGSESIDEEDNQEGGC